MYPKKQILIGLALIFSLSFFGYSESFFELSRSVSSARKLALNNKKNETISFDDTGLDLSGLMLEAVPEKILNFNNLIFLNLSGNRIALNDSDCALLSQMEKIIEISFVANNLSKIPDNIGLLSENADLKMLSFSGNPISNVSRRINDLKSVRSMDFSFCSMKMIPQPILENANIHYLFLSFNKLPSIPSFLKMEELKVLDLSNNPLNGVDLNVELLPPALTELNLKQTGVSKDSIVAVSKARPNLKILY